MTSEISDHLPIFGVFDFKGIHEEQPAVFKHQINDMNVNCFLRDLSTTDFTCLLSVYHEEPNLMYEKFMEVFSEIYHTCFPLKKIIYKKNHKPWFTKELKRMCSRKNYLYKKYIKNPTELRKDCYNKFRNLYTNQIRSAKRNYYFSKFRTFKGNINKTWRTINDILQRKKYQKNSSVFKCNNSVVSDSKEIAESFNDYFKDVGHKLGSMNRNVTNINCTSYLNSNFPHTAYFLPITEKEIINNALSFKNGKAPGFDSIDCSVVKKVIHVICKPLCNIFNSCIEQGVVPVDLKIAKIIPIHKKGPKDIFSNYRPISLLPLFSKIFEKCIYTRLHGFLDKHSILYNKQFGFRARYSTDHALLDFLIQVSKAIENKEIIVGIFLDFKKAFDSINHDILLSKLYYYGIRGVTLQLFRSYLNDRKQFTVFNSKNSSLQLVSCGIPQGSIIGPLLFLIYINDLHSVSPILNFILFADDTNIFYKHKDVECLTKNLNNELLKVSKWIKANKLQLNYEKTNVMLFNFPKTCVSEVKIYMNGNLIEHTSSTKFLGINIDKDLKWKTHVYEVLRKVSRTIGIMSKLKDILPTKILIMLYNSLILPYISYCNIIWGFCKQHLLNRIFLLQKRAVRIICHKPFLSPSRPLFLKLNILPISLLHDFQLCVFMYSYYHNLLPEIFCNIFQSNNDIHRYNTRTSADTRVIYGHSSFSNSIFLCQGPTIWNKLPPKLKQCASLNSFKHHLKLHLIQQI